MPDLPPVFEQSIPLPGNRNLPLWAIGIGAAAAIGVVLLSRLRSASSTSSGVGGKAVKVNVSGLQTNQFFQALSQQGVNLQQQLAKTQAALTQQTTSQINALNTQLGAQISTLSSQMQTGFQGTAEQVQRVNVRVSNVEKQVNDLAAHEARVNAEQAKVFSRAWAEIGGPVTAVQVAEHFPSPQQYGVGPRGVWITDDKGNVRWQDTSQFGTLVQ